eukprot:NP_001257269.1 Uncharacterized protein CELE_Y7A5A.20 [Caenorhabditis elegans]
MMLALQLLLSSTLSAKLHPRADRSSGTYCENLKEAYNVDLKKKDVEIAQLKTQLQDVYYQREIVASLSAMISRMLVLIIATVQVDNFFGKIHKLIVSGSSRSKAAPIKHDQMDNDNDFIYILY